MEEIVKYVIASGITTTAISLILIALLNSSLFVSFVGRFFNRFFISRETHIVELAKKGFNETLESFKADLNRNNIAFQIANAEYVKRQYIYLEELYSKAYEMKVNIRDKVRREKVGHVEVKKNIALIRELLEDFRRRGFTSSFYLNEKSKLDVFEYADTIESLIDNYSSYVENVNDYDYFSVNPVEQIGEDEFEVYTGDDLENMQKRAGEFLVVCTEGKRECELKFYVVEAAINNILRRSEKA